MLRATLVGHPFEKRIRVKIDAVAVQATVSTVGGHVAALGVTVSMLGLVGAYHTGPAFVIGFRQ